MKTVLITLLFVVSGSAAYPDENRIAALESKIEVLERQNLSLKAAIEAVSGKSLSQILQGVPVPVPPVATSTNSAPDKSALKIAEIEAQIAALQAQWKKDDAGGDPFKEKAKLGKSRADILKEREQILRDLEYQKRALMR